MLFERLWVPHYKKKVFPKSEPLQSLMTSYFRNGCLIMKNTSYLFFVIKSNQSIKKSINKNQSIEMYTQGFQKYNKNEFLCLLDDVIVLMTSCYNNGGC